MKQSSVTCSGRLQPALRQNDQCVGHAHAADFSEISTVLKAQAHITGQEKFIVHFI